MKDLTTTPTAELLAEWERLNGIVKHHASGIYRVYAKNCLPYRPSDYERDEAIDGMTTIADELNRRCSELGVGSKDGRPIFRFYTTDKPTEGLVTEIVAIYVDSPPYTLEELRDLLTWLLLKGGNG